MVTMGAGNNGLRNLASKNFKNKNIIYLNLVYIINYKWSVHPVRFVIIKSANIYETVWARSMKFGTREP